MDKKTLENLLNQLNNRLVKVEEQSKGLIGVQKSQEIKNINLINALKKEFSSIKRGSTDQYNIRQKRLHAIRQIEPSFDTYMNIKHIEDLGRTPLQVLSNIRGETDIDRDKAYLIKINELEQDIKKKQRLYGYKIINSVFNWTKYVEKDVFKALKIFDDDEELENLIDKQERNAERRKKAALRKNWKTKKRIKRKTTNKYSKK